MSLIFISVASKTATNGKHLTSAFLEDMARLHDRHPDNAFLCPVIHGYTLLPYLNDTVATWQVWGKYCEKVLTPCDELWVILGPGWQNPSTKLDGKYNTSEGVYEEIKIAIKQCKKIVFYNTEILYAG